MPSSPMAVSSLTKAGSEQTQEKGQANWIQLNATKSNNSLTIAWA